MLTRKLFIYRWEFGSLKQLANTVPWLLFSGFFLYTGAGLQNRSVLLLFTQFLKYISALNPQVTPFSALQNRVTAAVFGATGILVNSIIAAWPLSLFMATELIMTKIKLIRYDVKRELENDGQDLDNDECDRMVAQPCTWERIYSMHARMYALIACANTLYLVPR